MNTRRIFSWLHLWLGIVSSIPVIIICATGFTYALREYISYENEDFWAWILDGHCFLWLPLPYGRNITGYAVLTFLVILVSGVIIQWPGRWTTSALRIRFWFSGPIRTKRILLNLHLVLGMWVLIPLIISCLTGMLMALDWFQDILFMFVPEERQIDVLMMNSEIHDGSIIGHTGRIIMLVCAAIGGSLPLTGMILYIRRKFFFKGKDIK